MTDGPQRITQPLRLVLQALLEGGEMHGWAIMKAVHRPGPTVYNLLERMAEWGWLESRWEEEKQPSVPLRRFYRLTVRGEKAAKEIAQS
jgi:PadR family transcriptional regulator PadR